MRARAASATDRPAFYALAPGGWRDLVTLLHPPYTAWHLSYVAIGAALAPTLHVTRLLWALAAFLLAVGVAAHALDELHDRPLRTSLSDRTLIVLAVVAGCAQTTPGAADGAVASPNAGSTRVDAGSLDACAGSISPDGGSPGVNLRGLNCASAHQRHPFPSFARQRPQLTCGHPPGGMSDIAVQVRGGKSRRRSRYAALAALTLEVQ